MATWVCFSLSSGACIGAGTPSATGSAPQGEPVCIPAPASHRGDPKPEPSGSAAAPARSDSPSELSPTRAHTLLAINPGVQPYKIQVPARCFRQGSTYIAKLRICVSATGAVTRVDVLKPSIPYIDAQLPIVIGRWRFHPYLHEGQPAPFCYGLNYRVQ